MNRVLLYFSLAGVAVILQTVIMPLVLQGYFKPDLILILVVYLGLHEGPWRGGLMVYSMGWFYDGVAGGVPGLNGFVLLGIFLAVRGLVTRLNAESSPLLLVLVMAATVLQSALLAFALDFFRQEANSWLQIAWQLPIQLLLNLIAALVLLRAALWLEKAFLRRRVLPGFRKLGNRYDS